MDLHLPHRAIIQKPSSCDTGIATESLAQVTPLRCPTIRMLDALALDAQRTLSLPDPLALDPVRTFCPLNALALHALRTFCPLDALALHALRTFGPLDALALHALRTFGPLDALALDPVRALGALDSLALDALRTLRALGALALDPLRTFRPLCALLSFGLVAAPARLGLGIAVALGALAGGGSTQGQCGNTGNQKNLASHYNLLACKIFEYSIG